MLTRIVLLIRNELKHPIYPFQLQSGGRLGSLIGTSSTSSAKGRKRIGIGFLWSRNSEMVYYVSDDFSSQCNEVINKMASMF